jgi:hypothetical protein
VVVDVVPPRIGAIRQPTGAHGRLGHVKVVVAPRDRAMART